MECTLADINPCVETYLNTDTRATQDDAMVFLCALKNLSTEGQVKVYTRTTDYHARGIEGGIILLKAILLESGL